MATPNTAPAGARPEPNDIADFQEITGVSRETLDRLRRYEALLKQWQRRINLVGRGTLADVWRRHFLDSAQLFALASPAEKAGVWLDIGSGAGFPGLVLAIMGVGHMHLVESDKRKAAFLREVARETGAPATIHAERVESLDPFPVDVVTARAVAPLARLLEMAAPFWGPETIGLFLKGRDIEMELTEAAKYWKMDIDYAASRTAEDSRIIRVKSLSRRTMSASAANVGPATNKGDTP